MRKVLLTLIAMCSLMVLSGAGPAEAAQEKVTWTAPNAAAPGFVAADNVRVDSGPTATTLVKGALLPASTTTTTIPGLALNTQNCVQVFYVNALGDSPVAPAAVCGIPASPTPGTGLQIQFLP